MEQHDDFLERVLVWQERHPKLMQAIVIVLAFVTFVQIWEYLR